MADSAEKQKNNRLLLRVFLYFYSVSSVLVLMAFIITAAEGKVSPILLPSAIIAAMVAYGIYNKLSWTPFVITILAAFSIISNMFRLPGEPLISLIFILILAFEIYFFNKKEIKQLFHVKKATTIF